MKALLAIAAAGALAAAPATSRDQALWTFDDDAAHVRALYPAGWHATERPVSYVASPKQRLVVANFPIPHAGPDSRLPSHGAFVFVYEFAYRQRGWPLRPAHVALRGPQVRDAAGCLGYAWAGWNIPFRIRGRDFAAVVSFGRRATAETKRRTLAVLDSIRVGSYPHDIEWVP